jgi:hypothetical protein
MTETDADVVHGVLADRIGTALRGVIMYDGEALDYTLREDVAAAYSESEIRAFVDNSIVHQLDTPSVEASFRLGGLEAVVRTFERSWVAQVPDAPKSGCLFSVERESGVTMGAVADGVAIVETELQG